MGIRNLPILTHINIFRNQCFNFLHFFTYKKARSLTVAIDIKDYSRGLTSRTSCTCDGCSQTYTSSLVQPHNHYLQPVKREKGRDLTQSYDKSPFSTEKSKEQRDNIKNVTKTWIKQRLRTDLIRSVGVTAVAPLMWFNRFTSAQPSHLP